MKYKQRFKDMPIDTSWTYEEHREWFIRELSDYLDNLVKLNADKFGIKSESYYENLFKKDN